MSDELALRGLAAEYAIAVDALDGAGFASVFLPGGSLIVYPPNKAAVRQGHADVVHMKDMPS